MRLTENIHYSIIVSQCIENGFQHPSRCSLGVIFLEVGEGSLYLFRGDDQVLLPHSLDKASLLFGGPSSKLFHGLGESRSMLGHSGECRDTAVVSKVNPCRRSVGKNKIGLQFALRSGRANLFFNYIDLSQSTK